MSQELDLTCKLCGAPISVSGAKRNKICRACSLKALSARAKERKEEENRRNPHYCVICGKQIEWTSGRKHQNVQTCSRRCAMLMAQQKMKEPKEHLEERLISYIKEQGRYVSLKEMRKALHISDKLLYSRGISCPDLNRRAGNYFPVNDKTAEQIRAEYAKLIQENKGIRLQEAARAIGVSGDYITSLGIRPSDIRKELGIHNKHSRTKEELENLIIDWLKEQPVYCSEGQIREALHLDHECSFKRYSLNVKELNAIAGHKPVYQSYYEDMATHLLLDHKLRIETQKTFPDCVMKKRLRFDFWLCDYGVLIEVDGEQHYKPSFGLDAYNRITKSDAIKNAFVAEHNIPLYRIDVKPSYTFRERFIELIDKITGPPRASDEVQTDSNCGDIQTDSAEDNPQPRSKSETIQMEFDF